MLLIHGWVLKKYFLPYGLLVTEFTFFQIKGYILHYINAHIMNFLKVHLMDMLWCKIYIYILYLYGVCFLCPQIYFWYTVPFHSLGLSILKTETLLKVKHCIFHYKFSLHSNENWISRLKTDLKINPQISSSRDFSLQLVTQDFKNFILGTLRCMLLSWLLLQITCI